MLRGLCIIFSLCLLTVFINSCDINNRVEEPSYEPPIVTEIEYFEDREGFWQEGAISEFDGYDGLVQLLGDRYFELKNGMVHTHVLIYDCIYIDWHEPFPYRIEGDTIFGDFLFGGDTAIMHLVDENQFEFEYLGIDWRPEFTFYDVLPAPICESEKLTLDANQIKEGFWFRHVGGIRGDLLSSFRNDSIAAADGLGGCLNKNYFRISGDTLFTEASILVPGDTTMIYFVGGDSIRLVVEHINTLWREEYINYPELEYPFCN